MLDLRNLIGDKSQVYSINGTSATYKQDSALTREISLVANLGYEKRLQIMENLLGIFKNTNQMLKAFKWKFRFKPNFN